MPSLAQLLTVVAAAAVLVAGVMVVLVTDHYEDETDDLYRGYVYFGLEMRLFRPCGRGEVWWIDEHYPVELEILYRRMTSSHNPLSVEPPPMYVELRGAISPLGRFGHMGTSDRVLSVNEVAFADRVYRHDRQCKPGLNSSLPSSIEGALAGL